MVAGLGDAMGDLATQKDQLDGVASLAYAITDLCRKSQSDEGAFLWVCTEGAH